MGGEKLLSDSLALPVLGSPPRGRGKENKKVKWYRSPRITPAWAGKSCASFVYSLLSRDHPRVGGEKCYIGESKSSETGSPPRGRGKEYLSSRVLGFIRITPAWAGKSKEPLKICEKQEDHPRVGGEKLGQRVPISFSLGSPPRGRGKVQNGLQLFRENGITPAWAGKRLKRSHRSGIFISRPIPFHSVLHRPAGSGGSRAGRDGSPAGQPQNTGPA